MHAIICIFLLYELMLFITELITFKPIIYLDMPGGRYTQSDSQGAARSDAACWPSSSWHLFHWQPCNIISRRRSENVDAWTTSTRRLWYQTSSFLRTSSPRLLKYLHAFLHTILTTLWGEGAIIPTAKKNLWRRCHYFHSTDRLKCSTIL